MPSADDLSLVNDTVAAAPGVQGALPPLPTGDLVPAAPAQPCFDEQASLRHGRVIGKVFGLCAKNVAGKPLDDDLEKTAGDVLGEAFGLLGRFGNRMAYVGALLGLVAVPLALTGYWWWRTEGAKDVTPKGGG